MNWYRKAPTLGIWLIKTPSQTFHIAHLLLRVMLLKPRHCPFPTSLSHQSHPHPAARSLLEKAQAEQLHFMVWPGKVKQPQSLVSSQEEAGMWWVRRWVVPTVGTEEQTQGTAPLMNHSSHLKDINAQITLNWGWGWDLGWHRNLGHNSFLESRVVSWKATWTLGHQVFC